MNWIKKIPVLNKSQAISHFQFVKVPLSLIVFSSLLPFVLSLEFQSFSFAISFFHRHFLFLCCPVRLFNMLSFYSVLLRLCDVMPLPLYAFFPSPCGAALHSMPCSFTCATVFRCRRFITEPCFSWACAQKQCVLGWAWHCSLFCRSKAKGCVTTAYMPFSEWTEEVNSIKDTPLWWTEGMYIDL